MDEQRRDEAPGPDDARIVKSSPGAIPPQAPPIGWLSLLTTRVLVPVLLGVLVVALARLFIESTCETYDEYTYLRMGICIFREGDFKSLASPMCPPMPILLEYGLPAIQARVLPDAKGWQWEVPALVRQSRYLTSLLVGAPLVCLVYAWIARRRGWAAGAFAGGMLALSPSILAAASIATTDACFALFATLALTFLYRYQVRPSLWSFLAAGSAIGLAMSAKQSGVILFAVVLVEWLLRLPGRQSGWTRVDFVLRTLLWLGLRLGSMITLAFLVNWAVYGFRLAPKFNDAGNHINLPEIIPMVADLLPNKEAIMAYVRTLGPPLALDTFVGQMDHASLGHHAFLMGQYSYKGWWYYFPIAIAIKSTPAELAMIGLVVVLACRPANWRDPTKRLWLCSIAVMLGSGMCSKLNIGHRYMLFIYPVVAMMFADWLGEFATRRRARAIILGVLVLAWQAVSIVGIAPHYLSYFNSFCGGPLQGYRYLVDSNLDWGQDLPSLRRELEARSYRKVALCYFGTANAEVYGLRAVDWLTQDESTATDCDWFAVSATALQGVYNGNSGMADRFGSLPSVRVGYSIFLYDLKNPQIREAWDVSRLSAGLLPSSLVPLER